MKGRMIYVIESRPAKVCEPIFKHEWSPLSHDTDMTREEARALVRGIRLRGGEARVVKYVPQEPRP